MLMSIGRAFGNLLIKTPDESQDVSPRLINTSLRYKLADAFSKPFNNELRLSANSSNRIAILRERAAFKPVQSPVTDLPPITPRSLPGPNGVSTPSASEFYG